MHLDTKKRSRSLVISLGVFLLFPLFSANQDKSTTCLSAIKGNDWVAQSQKNAEAIRKIPFKEVNLRPHQLESGLWGRYGLPSRATIIRAGDRVFRHYTTETNLKSILEDRTLKAAHVYYEEVSPGLRYVYFDLSGVFATTPASTRTSVGVGDGGRESKRHYIDFRLPPDTILIELPKDIFLVPGPKGHPPAFHDEVRKYKTNPSQYSDSFYKPLIAKFIEDGEPAPMQTDIIIVADGVDDRAE